MSKLYNQIGPIIQYLIELINQETPANDFSLQTALTSFLRFCLPAFDAQQVTKNHFHSPHKVIE